MDCGHVALWHTRIDTYLLSIDSQIRSQHSPCLCTVLLYRSCVSFFCCWSQTARCVKISRGRIRPCMVESNMHAILVLVLWYQFCRVIRYVSGWSNLFLRHFQLLACASNLDTGTNLDQTFCCAGTQVQSVVTQVQQGKSNRPRFNGPYLQAGRSN